MTLLIGWVWPKDWGALLAVLGLSVSVSVALSSLLASVANLLHLIQSSYHLVGFYMFGGVCSVLVACYLICVFVMAYPVSESVASDHS